jgi:hypothetical protein
MLPGIKIQTTAGGKRSKESRWDHRGAVMDIIPGVEP